MAQTGMQRFFVRILLFQYIIIVAVFQLINLEQSAKTFMENYSDGKSRMHIGNDYGIEGMMKMEDRYVVVYKFYCIAMGVCAMLAMISNMCLLKFITAVLFGVGSFVTYNPVLPQNKIVSNNLYGLRCELIISAGILIGIAMNMFLPKYSEMIKVESDEEEIISEKKETSKGNVKKGKKKIQ